MAARDKLNKNTAMAKDFESYVAKCERARQPETKPSPFATLS